MRLLIAVTELVFDLQDFAQVIAIVPHLCNGSIDLAFAQRPKTGTHGLDNKLVDASGIRRPGANRFFRLVIDRFRDSNVSGDWFPSCGWHTFSLRTTALLPS